MSPDYLTRSKFGGFYGWPWNYWGGHDVDTRVKPERPEMVAKCDRAGLCAGRAHARSLGLTFADGAQLGRAVQERRVHRPARLVEPRSVRPATR